MKKAVVNSEPIPTDELFLPKLKAAKSFADCQAILSDRQSSSDLCYTHFGWFMQYFTPPPGASNPELVEYLRIFRRLACELSLPASVTAAIELAHETAIASSDASSALCA